MREAKKAKSEKELLEAAISWLRTRLPCTWIVDEVEKAPGTMLRIQGGSFFASVAIEAKSSLTPREATGLLRGFGRVLKSINTGTALLVVAPWLSRRTREILAADGINYIDLSGNALVRLDNPALYIETLGSDRNPEPRARGKARLRGPKAGRLIRLLLDVRPPYGPGEIAEATSLAPGYVSRLLDTLYAEALIERAPRGPVESVDTVGLIRRWADSYDVFKTNKPTTFIAPAGLAQLLERLAVELDPEPGVAITGSFAAARLEPVSAPSQLLFYCERPALFARELGLLPAEDGANVVLLEPYDPVVWQRCSVETGLPYVAPSQAAVDCLTGNGRMPAEGEALLTWMQANEEGWRLGALHPELDRETG